MTGWLLQVPNVLGFAGNVLLGRKHRHGWLVCVGSEVAWVSWAYLSHNPGLYPWCALWAAVFARNWWLWRDPVVSLPSDLPSVEAKHQNP